MNIRLFRIYSVPIRISSPEFHVPGTCLFIVWGARSHHVPLYKVGRHVATTCFSRNRIVWGGTWLPRATYVNYSYFCALEGVRIYTYPYMCTQLKYMTKSLV